MAAAGAACDAGAVMRLLRSLTFHTSAIVLGSLWFCLLLAAWATGAGLLVTLLGLPVIWLTLATARELAAFEAVLARSLIGADVAAPPRLDGWQLRRRVADPRIW